MKFINGWIYNAEYRFAPGGFVVNDGRFSAIGANPAELSGGVMTDPYTAAAGLPRDAGDVVDLAGKTVIPGLVEVHHHGNSGSDFSYGDPDGLLRMLRFLASQGILSVSPASMTLPEEALSKAFANARKFRDEKPANAARLVGITMEGPFFNEAKKGAQNPAYLKKPDVGFFRRLQAVSDGMIRIACVSPELDGALDFIREVSQVCTVSVAHTNADYEQARAGFAAGARHVTHLFNAMPPLAHRQPGVIGAAAEHPDVTAELIVDGVHIHPSAVRAAFAMFGASRIVLVSDSMAACGMPDGTYDLGGQDVNVRGRKATLADGTIAGSATHLFDCMRTAIAYGIPPADAVRAATANPARVIGLADQTGTIAVGRVADFVVCNPDWSIDSIWIGGKKLDMTR